MNFLTPLAKKLLLVWLGLLLFLPAMTLWRWGRDYWKIQHGDVSLVVGHPFYRGEKAELKLKALLDHQSWSTRSKAAELLLERGYIPSSPEERVAFALAANDFRYAPLQINEVLDQLESKMAEGYEFYMGFFSRDANIDLRFQKLYRAYTFQGLGNEYWELPVEECPPHNGYFISLANGIGWGDRQWLETCVQNPVLKLESREWAVLQLGQLRSYDSIDMFVKTFLDEAFSDWGYITSGLKTPYDVFQWIPDDRALPVLLQQINQENPNTGNTARAAIEERWDSPIIVRAVLERFLASDPHDENFKQEAYALNYRRFSWELDKTELKPVRFPSPRKPRSHSSRDSTRVVTDQEIKQLSAQIQEILTPVPGQQEKGYAYTESDNLLEDVLPSDHPELLPLIKALNLRKYISSQSYARDHSWYIGLESLGKMGDTNSVPRLLSCLRSQSSAYRGLEAMGDPRVIPQIKTVLPEVIWFKHAMRTLEALGWEPETEEERAFQLIYRQEIADQKELVYRLLREQIASTEVRRREFAAYAIVGLGIEDLVPDLVAYLGVDGDGRIANYMFHSGQPELVEAAEYWREHAPLGLKIPNYVDAGWGKGFE